MNKLDAERLRRASGEICLCGKEVLAFRIEVRQFADGRLELIHRGAARKRVKRRNLVHVVDVKADFPAANNLNSPEVAF